VLRDGRIKFTVILQNARTIQLLRHIALCFLFIYDTQWGKNNLIMSGY
jgi:hypothetical protein